MGRETPRERRAHLFAVIEAMTRQRSQGEADTNAAGIAHLIEISKLSRASYYRWLEPKLSARDDADLRDLIQRLALQRRHEGYRRITKRLRDEGLIINSKRVLRLMRADNLLSLRQKPFVPSTTDSQHKFKIVPNLAHRLEASGLDQLWVADITYIRLAEGFVYLAIVVDAFSRKSLPPRRRGSWAMRSTIIWRRASPWRRSIWRFRRETRGQASSIIPIAACNMHRANMRRDWMRMAFSAA
jgi:hypothetical protein